MIKEQYNTANWNDDVISHKRFKFGENWKNFSKTIDDSRIEVAEKSLLNNLGVSTLENMSFLDVGCGSGLFSLAAIRLGAKVVSVDFDPDSVSCCQALKEKYAKNAEWEIRQESVLNEGWLSSLGCFDVVYSWGVLHHTGDMWAALKNVVPLVKEKGLLYISIYNHQPLFTPIWTAIKKLYNKSDKKGQNAIVWFCGTFEVCGLLVYDTLHLRNPFSRFKGNTRRRGMSIWHDFIDWYGGYPFETATPAQIKTFFFENGYSLKRESLVGNKRGCNEFVFIKN
jgi:2-polyprenyl-3-methyl-5-hydroxy-6-metoxy-1,4-benzoquinol methylase